MKRLMGGIVTTLALVTTAAAGPSRSDALAVAAGAVPGLLDGAGDDLFETVDIAGDAHSLPGRGQALGVEAQGGEGRAQLMGQVGGCLSLGGESADLFVESGDFRGGHSSSSETSR